MPNNPAVPTFDALMWPALKAIKALGGSANHDELLAKIIELENIPESVQNVMHTDSQTKLAYNLAWAKTYLGKYGALENPSHGLWAITEKGKTLTEQDTKVIPGEVRKQYKDKIAEARHYGGVHYRRPVDFRRLAGERGLQQVVDSLPQSLRQPRDAAGS